MSCSAYYFGHGDPHFNEIRQKYDKIEEKIKKYHEKSQNSNSVSKLYMTNRDYFGSSLIFSPHKTHKTEKIYRKRDAIVDKQLQNLKDVISFAVFSLKIFIFWRNLI